MEVIPTSAERRRAREARRTAAEEEGGIPLSSSARLPTPAVTPTPAEGDRTAAARRLDDFVSAHDGDMDILEY